MNPTDRPTSAGGVSTEKKSDGASTVLNERTGDEWRSARRATACPTLPSNQVVSDGQFSSVVGESALPAEAVVCKVPLSKSEREHSFAQHPIVVAASSLTGADENFPKCAAGEFTSQHQMMLSWLTSARGGFDLANRDRSSSAERRHPSTLCVVLWCPVISTTAATVDLRRKKKEITSVVQLVSG